MRLMPHEKQRIDLECWIQVAEAFAFALNPNFKTYGSWDDFKTTNTNDDAINKILLKLNVENQRKIDMNKEYIHERLCAVVENLINLKNSA